MRTREPAGVGGAAAGILLFLVAPIAGDVLLAQGALPDPSAESEPAVLDSLDHPFVGPPRPPLYLPDRMERLLAEAGSMQNLTSLIIARRGSLVVENYYRGAVPSSAVNVKSVSKTLLSPMIGIAIRGQPPAGCRTTDSGASARLLRGSGCQRGPRSQETRDRGAASAEHADGPRDGLVRELRCLGRICRLGLRPVAPAHGVRPGPNVTSTRRATHTCCL